MTLCNCQCIHKVWDPQSYREKGTRKRAGLPQEHSASATHFQHRSASMDILTEGWFLLLQAIADQLQTSCRAVTWRWTMTRFWRSGQPRRTPFLPGEGHTSSAAHSYLLNDARRLICWHSQRTARLAAPLLRPHCE